MRAVLSSFLFLLLLNFPIFSQAPIIELKNPSFEGVAMPNRVPIDWEDCGFKGESAPDTHVSGAFDVLQTPKEGATYLGMVTRDNNTYESVTQKLETPLLAEQCYAFKISLCRSPIYISASRISRTRANYVVPAKLLIFGGNKWCEKTELLAESELVDHEDWRHYLFTFQPKQEYRFLQLVAYYEEPILQATNGNILLDDASNIVPFSYDSTATWKIEQYSRLLEVDLLERTPVKRHPMTDQVVYSFGDKPKAKSKPKPPTKVETPEIQIPAIYYNSRLDSIEKDESIQAIVDFANENPLFRANVVIEEDNHKLAKQQIKAIKKALADRNIHKLACRFTIVK
ncbi:MAG: hypothetical protein AAGJ18_26425 [Bacteroidota bacterium]